MHGTSQRGSASVEYVVVTLALVAVLFAPLSDAGSAVDLVLDAFRRFQDNSTFLLSMP